MSAAVAGGAAYIVLQQMEEERRRAMSSMKGGNPGNYECQGKKTRGKIHRWKRRPDGTARCLNCDIVLTKAQTDDLFHAK